MDFGMALPVIEPKMEGGWFSAQSTSDSIVTLALHLTGPGNKYPVTGQKYINQWRTSFLCGRASMVPSKFYFKEEGGA
jgi:hypothetical protein